MLAFDRGGAVTVVTRLPLGLGAGRLGRDACSPSDGGPRRVADVLGDDPVAVLVEDGS